MNRTDVEILHAQILTRWGSYHELTKPEITARVNAMQASLDRDMPHDWAMAWLEKRWATYQAKEPRPGDFNHAWRAERAQRDRPKPCGDPMCDGHGWVNGKQGNGNLIAEKCPNCPPRIRVSGLHSVNDQEPAAPPPPEFYAKWKELANRKRLS